MEKSLSYIAPLIADEKTNKQPCLMYEHLVALPPKEKSDNYLVIPFKRQIGEKQFPYKILVSASMRIYHYKNGDATLGIDVDHLLPSSLLLEERLRRLVEISLANSSGFKRFFQSVPKKEIHRFETF